MGAASFFPSGVTPAHDNLLVLFVHAKKSCGAAAAGKLTEGQGVSVATQAFGQIHVHS